MIGGFISVGPQNFCLNVLFVFSKQNNWVRAICRDGALLFHSPQLRDFYPPEPGVAPADYD